MTISLHSLTLPDNLRWIDEFNWSPVRATSKCTLGGRRVRYTVRMPGESGRPVTLGGEAFMRRDLLLQLQDLVVNTENAMELLLHDGSRRSVLWRHQDAPVIEATLVVDYADPRDDHYYRVSAIKLEVE